MKIGILKELHGENRVSMLPDNISALVSLKTQVLIERGAGDTAFVTDDEYKAAGAGIMSRKEVMAQADIILMIHAPDSAEIKELREDQVFIGAFNPMLNHMIVNDFVNTGVTSFSLDVIPRTTRAQTMDILSSQATVAGYKAVLDAANRFGGFLNMFMSAAGTIKPAKVMVLGAGVAGLQAIATARKLGAVVEAFDVRAASKSEVQSLGAKFIEVEGSVDRVEAGGYAVEQTEEFKKKQRQAIHDHAIKSDIIICTAQIPGKKAPLLLFRDTIEAMSPGSVVIDLAASTGGNCEVTIDNQVVNRNNVFVIGKSNYPSEMPVDASLMFGKNMFNFVRLLIDSEGNLNLDMKDDLIQGTCVTFKNRIIHNRVLESIKVK